MVPPSAVLKLGSPTRRLDPGDELSIAPVDGLDYAAGDLDVVALRYEITIDTGATDLVGYPLDAPLTLTFDTMREITQQLPAVAELSGSALNTGLTMPSIVVGDQQIGTIKSDLRALVTFDLTPVPSDAVFDTIRFAAAQSDVTGNPFDLGPLHLESVFYDGLDPWTYGAEPHGGHQLTASDGEVPVWSADARSTVEDDLMNREVRNNLCQYRIRFETANNDDGDFDKLGFAPSSIALELTYLAE